MARIPAGRRAGREQAIGRAGLLDRQRDRDGGRAVDHAGDARCGGADAARPASRCCPRPIKGDVREGDIGTELGEIAKQHPNVIDRQLSVLRREDRPEHQSGDPLARCRPSRGRRDRCRGDARCACAPRMRMKVKVTPQLAQLAARCLCGLCDPCGIGCDRSQSCCPDLDFRISSAPTGPWCWPGADRRARFRSARPVHLAAADMGHDCGLGAACAALALLSRRCRACVGRGIDRGARPVRSSDQDRACWRRKPPDSLIAPPPATTSRGPQRGERSWRPSSATHRLNGAAPARRARARSPRKAAC